MEDLSKFRQAIDNIDDNIIRLLKERMDVATAIADYKLEHNQSITDKAREQQKLNTLEKKALSYELMPSYIHDLYTLIMKYTCAKEQHDILSKLNHKPQSRDTSVAYLGTKGSYSHVAATKFFEGFLGKIEAFGCENFEQIVGNVETHNCEFGVLPVENSSSGSINEVLDILQTTKSTIVGEQFLQIDHSILGIKNISLNNITDVYSHPQPLAQCSQWLHNMLPHVRIHYTKATSEAMETVKQKQDPFHVAIASRLAASFFDLVPLFDNISNNPHNLTRFIIIYMTPTLVPLNVKAKTSLGFSVKKYTPGSLIKVLSEIYKHNLNLSKIISRPKIENTKETWEEIFFADLDGNANTEDFLKLLEDLKPLTSSLKVLGCYPSNE